MSLCSFQHPHAVGLEAHVRLPRMVSKDMSKQGCKVFIGGLSWDTNDTRLRTYFENFGMVKEAFVSYDKETGKPRGFGFVVFENPTVAERVVQNKHTIDRREVDAKHAMPRTESTGLRSSPRQDDPGSGVAVRKVFVGGLPPGVTDSVLRQFFEQCGQVEDAVVMMDHHSKRSRGFGFVTFSDEATVEAVIRQHSRPILQGKTVEVKRAVPREHLHSENSARRGAQLYSSPYSPNHLQQYGVYPSPFPSGGGPTATASHFGMGPFAVYGHAERDTPPGPAPRYGQPVPHLQGRGRSLPPGADSSWPMQHESMSAAAGMDQQHTTLAEAPWLADIAAPGSPATAHHSMRASSPMAGAALNMHGNSLAQVSFSKPMALLGGHAHSPSGHMSRSPHMFSAANGPLSAQAHSPGPMLSQMHGSRSAAPAVVSPQHASFSSGGVHESTAGVHFGGSHLTVSDQPAPGSMLRAAPRRGSSGFDVTAYGGGGGGMGSTGGLSSGAPPRNSGLGDLSLLGTALPPLGSGFFHD